MKKNIILFFLLLCSLYLVSCNKNSADNNFEENGNSSLWVALYDGEQGWWKFIDKKCYIYRDGRLFCTFPFLSRVVRKGNDIYAIVCVEESSNGWKYFIWKNGHSLFAIESQGVLPHNYIPGHHIFVNNNDIYSSGYEYILNPDGSVLSRKYKVWKNGKQLFEIDPIPAGGGSLYVEDSDVYVAGSAAYDPVKGHGPAVWKNGEIIFYGDDKVKGSGWNYLADIKCYYGNLYYAGSLCDEGDGGPHARIWKNNAVLYDLPRPHRWAAVYDMAFKDNNLYAVGYNQSFNGVVWKDGEILWEIEGTQQQSIVIIGDDIYTAGVVGKSTGGIGDDRLARIWKNGEVFQTFGYCQVVELIDSCD